MQQYIITHYVNAPFVVDGLSTGIIQVSPQNAPLLWPGAKAIVGSSAAGPVEALILEDLGNGQFRVRINDTSISNLATSYNMSQYGKAGSPAANGAPKAGSDWSTYLTADGAYIQQPQDQLIFNYTRDGVVPRVPSALQGQ